MSQQEVVTIHTDGASRGNPGPAALGYILKPPGEDPIEVKERIPNTTNNVAEYTALIKALEHAHRLHFKEVKVFADSELMVKQVKGLYKVKNEGLQPLHQKVLQLTKKFSSFKIDHIRREQNKEADRLCNEALDGDSAPSPKASRQKVSPNRTMLDHGNVHEEAIECLKAVAYEWARGNPDDPKPELVWDQLLSILEEGGILKIEKGMSKEMGKRSFF